MKGESGFTLLEVLISLLILSLIGLVLSEGISLGRRTFDRLEERTDAALQHAEATRILRRLIAASEPPGPLHYGATFRGGAERLDFTTTSTANLSGGKASRMTVMHDPEQAHLYLRIAQVRGDSVPEDTIILRDVSTLRFRYWGGSDEDPQEEWLDPSLLPHRIEARIGSRAFGKTTPITVLLRRRLSAECLVAGISHCLEETP